MRQTSILSFRSLTPVHLNQQQQKVKEAIEEYFPVTDKTLAELTGIPINVITPRRGELLKKKVIEEAYIRIQSNGRKATFWKPTEAREYESTDVA